MPRPGEDLGLDHDESVLAAEQIRELVNHCLDNVLQIRTQLLEVAHVGEVDGNECGPPADGQVLAVHAVQLRVVRDAVGGLYT